jgi:hypothetical protein
MYAGLMVYQEFLPTSSALEADLLVDIGSVSVFFSDPYAYAKGWPYLTLVEVGEVRFIEVKTTDRLHISQIITIGKMKRAAGLGITVARVAR